MLALRQPTARCYSHIWSAWSARETDADVGLNVTHRAVSRRCSALLRACVCDGIKSRKANLPLALLLQTYTYHSNNTILSVDVDDIFHLRLYAFTASTLLC